MLPRKGRAGVDSAPAFVLAVLVQAALFGTALVATPWAPVGGPAVHVATRVLLVAALLANRRGWGPRLAALGTACNLLVIAVNGGRMPAQAGLLRRVQGEAAVERLTRGDTFVNVRLMDEQPRLPALGDVIAPPTWLPLANVVSLGDLLGALGVALWIVELLRAAPEEATRTRERDDRLILG